MPLSLLFAAWSPQQATNMEQHLLTIPGGDAFDSFLLMTDQHGQVISPELMHCAVQA